MSFVRWTAALAVAFVAGVSSSQADAKGLLNRVLAAPTPAPVAEPMPVPMPEGAVVHVGGTCCPTPCIRYRHALLPVIKVRCCDPCKPPVQAVLHAKNPCTCCPVDIPVCLPSCCCGEPTVVCHKVLLGEGRLTYTWCCGVSVDVRFRRCGDVLVTYHGA